MGSRGTAPRALIGAGPLWVLAIVTLARAGLALAAGAPALVLGVRRAYVAAPERIGASRTLPLVGRTHWPMIALAETHLASILRGQRPARWSRRRRRDLDGPAEIT